MKKENIEITNNEQNETMLAFVESLFESCKKPNMSGIYIELSDNSILHVEIKERGERIFVYMNAISMGFFEKLPDEPRGYKYIFNQQYRVGIRKGLNDYEFFMRNICNNPVILFLNAY